MADMQKVDREWMHRNNQKLILNAVLEGKEISKAQIAARTGMSVVSVGRITDELIAMGLLRETGGEAVPGQKAGRPAKRLALPLERLQCVCVALELQGIHLGLVDPYGTLRNRTWIPFPKETPLIQEEVMPWLARNLEQFFRENRKVRPLRWIGMVVQGIVDARRGEVVLTSRGWRNVPAVRYLEEHLPGCRVLLENETRATALAECTLGRAAEDQNAVVLNLGESVNAATLLNREIYRGGDGWAGEIGHVIVEPDGAPCICGQRGCLRTKLALGPVLEKAGRIYPGVNLAGLVEYAQRGEPEAQAPGGSGGGLRLRGHQPDAQRLCAGKGDPVRQYHMGRPRPAGVHPAALLGAHGPVYALPRPHMCGYLRTGRAPDRRRHPGLPAGAGGYPGGSGAGTDSHGARKELTNRGPGPIIKNVQGSFRAEG